nr:hypothetical protein [uncultured Christensenella sp.]
MKVIEHQIVPHAANSQITFIRIDPENLQDTLAHIMQTLLDLSWLSRFDQDYLKNSFNIRAQKTIADIQKKFNACADDTITKEAGEYVVSELARQSLISQMNFLDIPLSELLGMKISGNPGFDFHSQNTKTDTVIFGEAKYNSRQSAYAMAITQISEFIVEQKDIMQIADLHPFCTPAALQRASKGLKGFAIAFSAKSTASSNMIASILAHADFRKLLPFEEIVIVAVNL